MHNVLFFMLLLLSSCFSNVIQTRDHSVACYEGGQLKLNTILDPTYKLVFTGTQYELRLADSNKRLATFSQCEIEYIQPAPYIDPPDTR